MIGPLVDSGGLFVGGIIGAVFADIFPERLKKALPSIFGIITLCLGATLVGKAAALPVVTVSLILGTMLGEILYAEALLQKALRAIFGLLKSKRLGDENFFLMVITLVAAFCFGSMGFLGAFHEGLTGKPDILLTKAALDMFSGVVFGSILGFSVSLIALPQFAILALIYMGATTIAPLMPPPCSTTLRPAAALSLWQRACACATSRYFRSSTCCPPSASFCPSLACGSCTFPLNSGKPSQPPQMQFALRSRDQRAKPFDTPGASARPATGPADPPADQCCCSGWRRG